MESGKQGSSETSSEENDRQEQVKEDTGTTRRSYECTYCKRGFTNAQALGGHMNIHRKDRAKAKAQLTCSSSHSNKSHEDQYTSSRYVAPISSEPTKYFPVWEAQRNYPMYYQPSVSTSRYPHANYYESHDLLAPRSQSLSMNYQELLSANLSLRIGPTHREDNEVRRDIMKEDEVDLELRLGHDP